MKYLGCQHLKVTLILATIQLAAKSPNKIQKLKSTTIHLIGLVHFVCDPDAHFCMEFLFSLDAQVM
jgi:hypothetical protein